MEGSGRRPPAGGGPTDGTAGSAPAVENLGYILTNVEGRPACLGSSLSSAAGEFSFVLEQLRAGGDAVPSIV